MKVKHRVDGVMTLLRCLWSRIDENRSLGLAAEMAFWLFLSLLPLAAVAGLVAARFAMEHGGMVPPILDTLPSAAQQLILDELSRVAAWKGGEVGLGAAAMFVWLASSGFHAVFDGIELESNALPRPWWKKRLIALVACVALSLGVATVALLGMGVGWLGALFGDGGVPVATPTLFGSIFRLVLGAGLSLGLVCGLYWIALPPRTRKSMPIVRGALLAIALQIAIGFGFGLYIREVGDGGAYQAGLASIGVTMVSLYLFCVALLVGIEFNQMLAERKQLADAERALPENVPRPRFPRLRQRFSKYRDGLKT